MIKYAHIILVTEDDTVHKISLAVTHFRIDIGSVEVTKDGDEFRAYKHDGSAHIVIEGRRVKSISYQEMFDKLGGSDE